MIAGVGFATLMTNGAAKAADLAIILNNAFYQSHPNSGNGRTIAALDNRFREAGFDVANVRNFRRNWIESFTDQIGFDVLSADRVVVVLNGHIAHSASDNWLLATDAGRPNALNAGMHGVSINGLLELLGRFPGQTILAINDNGRDVNLSDWLGNGLNLGHIPQGVMVLHGADREIVRYIADYVLQPGQVLAEGLDANNPNLRAYGYLPRHAAFLPAQGNTSGGQNFHEQNLWSQAQSLGTVQAYENYLNAYPAGQYAAEAQDRIADLSLTPQDRARIAEEQLGLTRDQRRAIQRNLTLIGFDTAGVDGIFGNRSRNAIADWQSTFGGPVTGYLTANQISRLENEAAIRAEELRREAEERQRQEERQDRRYWNATGASGSEDGLRAYLQRYPDGIFADQANARLQEYEREQRRLARRAEREAWDRTVMAGTLEAYQGYLNEYPNGRFTQEAQARVASLSQPETAPEVVEAARQEEGRLRLNAITRTLVEGQLAQLNLDPGPADGRFTEETRRALRRFQRASDLPVTGFVTRATVVRLLASAAN